MKYLIRNKQGKILFKGMVFSEGLVPYHAAIFILEDLGISGNNLWLEVGGHCFSASGWLNM